MGLFGPSKKEKQLQEQLDQQNAEIQKLQAMLTPEYAQIEKLKEEIQHLEKVLEELKSQQKIYNNNIDSLVMVEKEHNLTISRLKNQIAVFYNEIDMLEYGIYKPTFDFATSDLYKDKLKEIRDKQKEYIKEDKAATGVTGWTVNGNAAQGKKMVADTKKLLLRAFNTECDDIVAKVRVSNLTKSIERIDKISEQISKLGNIMSISITQPYIQLKRDEVRLALDFQQKKQEEKDILKELRAQEREEAKALKEIEEEKKRLAKEQKH